MIADSEMTARTEALRSRCWGRLICGSGTVLCHSGPMPFGGQDVRGGLLRGENAVVEGISGQAIDEPGQHSSFAFQFSALLALGALLRRFPSPTELVGWHHAIIAQCQAQLS